MKKKVLTVMGILVIALLVVQLFWSPSIKLTVAEVQGSEGTYDSLQYINKCVSNGDELEETTHLISLKDELPSDNPEDYRSVYIRYDVKNHSYLQAQTVSGYIDDIGKYKDRVLVVEDSDGVLPTYVFRGYKDSSYVIMDVYTKNFSEDELRELINSVTLRVETVGDLIGSSSKKISVSEVEDIDIREYKK